MASRNTFLALRSVGFTTLLAGFVLSGCAAGGETVAEEGTNPAEGATTNYTPDPTISEIASTAGQGTAVSFPVSTPPSFSEPVPGADREKVYGSPFYKFSGDNVPIKTNIATHGEEEKSVMEELSQVPPGAKSIGPPMSGVR